MSFPESWQKEGLVNLTKFVDYRGKTPKKTAEGVPLITAKNIRNGFINREPREYIADEAYDGWMTRGIPEVGDVVITTEAPMGNVALIDITEKFALAQRAICLQFYVGGMGRYAHYALRSPEFQKSLTRNATGTTVSGIKAATLKSLELPIPSLAEQKVIADKLDSLLAQVETTKARLDRIPEILKRFRQSVLTAAVSGRLSEEWRKNNSVATEKPVLGKEKHKQGLFDSAKQTLPVLPNEWIVAPAATLLEYVTSGSRGWAKYYSENGALFLRMSNVRYNTTKLDLQDLQYVDLPHAVEGKRSLVSTNDLIISITADVGRVARVEKGFTEAYINQHLALARPTKEVDAEYLALCIASNVGLKQVEELKRGATKAGLGLNDIRSLAIPFPSLLEQGEIVRRVEELFAYADAVEQKAQAASERVNNLTQSILAKAFRGELTADWRATNPDLISGENSAEALLEKIKAEREALKPKKRARKVKA